MFHLRAFARLTLICSCVVWRCPAQTDGGGNKEILERLERLEKQNAALLDEMRALREEMAGGKRPQAAAETTSEARDRQEIHEQRIAELAQVKVEASQRFPLQLTGMALFNAFKNGRYGGDVQDPVTAVLNAGEAESGATFRQSILGLTFQGPKVFAGGRVSGSFYVDFFAGAGSSPYQDQVVRLRLATVQVDWANTTFSIGRDKPLISRRDPNSLAQVGVSPLTAAGNPWIWESQARVEQRIRLSENTSLRAAAGIFQTLEHAIANVSVDEARPAFETRVALLHKFGEQRSVEVAPVFHSSTSHVAGASIPSRLYGIDWAIKPAAYLEFTGLLFHGRNFSNLGALGGISLTAPRSPMAIHGSGGWAQLRLMPTQKLSFDVYAGQQDDRNTDLESGDIHKNQYYAANVMYYAAQNVLTSFEVGHAITSYLGIGNRASNHYDLAIAYLF